LLGASFVFWVSCGFWELRVCSFLWIFLGFLCGLAELSLCILPVYLGAPYACLMKFFYLSPKKKEKRKRKKSNVAIC
jgi:4-hydroxybenzoate polyprenyltransferase